MRRISNEEALKRAQDRLYNSSVEDIDKNLDAFLKAKKFIARNNRDN